MLDGYLARHPTTTGFLLVKDDTILEGVAVGGVIGVMAAVLAGPSRGKRPEHERQGRHGEPHPDRGTAAARREDRVSAHGSRTRTR